jgi:hypothetical protein
VGSITLHGVGYDGFGQGLGAARLTHQEKGNSQLYTDNHHKHILPQGLVLSNVSSNVVNLKEDILATVETNTSIT